MTRGLMRYFLSCVLLLPIFISGTAAAQEKIKAGISSFSASYISMFIANKRGYYAEEGMSVDIILIAGLLGTRALIGGSVEFGSASNPTAAVQGAKLKMLMVFNEKPHSALFTQPGIKSVAELRGKKIGGSTVGSLEYGWIKELLPKFGFAARSRRDVFAHRSDRDPLHGSKNRHSRRHAAGPSVQFPRPGCRLSGVDPGVRPCGRYSSLRRDNRRTADAPERDGAAFLEGHSERTAGLSGSA
jgi:NMT1/THI5 like